MPSRRYLVVSILGGTGLWIALEVVVVPDIWARLLVSRALIVVDVLIVVGLAVGLAAWLRPQIEARSLLVASLLGGAVTIVGVFAYALAWGVLSSLGAGNPGGLGLSVLFLAWFFGTEGHAWVVLSLGLVFGLALRLALGGAGRPTEARPT